jgi:hypothetical protein
MRRAKVVLLGLAISLTTITPLADGLLAQSQSEGQKTLYGVFNQRKLEIPITISQPEKVKEISELLLFVSSDNGKTWQQADFATPRRDSFSFVAERDGVYLFNVVTKYRNGTQDPPSLTAVPAKLQLLIDATRPVVSIKSLERSGEDALILWEVQDQHPDVQSLRLQYQPKGGQWIDLPIPPALSGSHRFKLSDSGPVLVRLSMKDAAGNVGSDERQLPAAANEPFRASVEANPSPTSPAMPPPQNHSTLPPPPSPQGALPLAQASPPSPPGQGALPMQPTAAPLPAQAPLTQTMATQPPANPPPLGHSAMNYAPMQPTPMQPTPMQPAPLPGRDPAQPLPTPGTLGTPGAYGAMAPAVPASPTVPPPPPLPAHTATYPGMGTNQPVAQSSPVGPLPPIQVVNTPRIALGYEVSKVGQSGLRSVDLWMTRDDGRTWERFATDPDKQSPIEVDLPGEGVYGFRLVLESGVGLSKGAPLPNTPPEIRVELDRTPPSIVMEKPQPEPGRTDTWRITWRAEDRNLASRPIALEYATQEDGPWLALTPEATHLPNTGYFAWLIPANFRPHHVYLRILARDTAGNVGEARWREPLLVDLSRPEGSITGLLRPVSTSPSSNSGGASPSAPPAMPSSAPTPAPAPSPMPSASPLPSPTPTPSVSAAPQAGPGNATTLPPRSAPAAAPLPGVTMPAPDLSVPLRME